MYLKKNYFDGKLKNNIAYFLGFIVSFFLGYFSNKLIAWNYDIFYLFSQLSFFLTLILVIINFFLKRYNFNAFIQIFGIYLISSASVGLLLGAIHEQYLFTRWLELGVFSTNDAHDYMQQIKEHLYSKEFYTGKGRVIFPILYSGFLGVFRLDIFTVQILVTVLCSMVTFFSTVLIQRNYGYIYAILFAFLSVDFLHENIGGICTENIGYILGGGSFICFLSFLNSNDRSLYYYSLCILLLFFGYLVRPSIVFILPAIVLFSFIYTSKFSKVNSVKILISTIIIFFSIAQFNKFLLNTTSPSSPKGFSNAYDSWYATGQLGNYTLNNQYKNLPPQLWSKIYQDYPNLINLKGENSSNFKKKILIENIIERPQDYVVGSLLQIVKFYEVSNVFKEEFHNTSGFLHIEFTLLRTLVLVFFTIGGIIATIFSIKNKNIKYLFFSFLYFSTLFSQPFIYGGEARTAATVILFLNFMLLFSVHYFFELVKKITLRNYLLREFIVKKRFKGQFTTMSLLPILVLFFFLFVGFYNKFDFILVDKDLSKYNCPNEKTVTNLHLNSKSGIFINQNNKNFEKILNTYVDMAATLNLLRGSDVILSISEEDFRKRDSFKFLRYLVYFTNTRGLTITNKEMKILGSLGKTFLSNGGFYSTPVNTETKKLEGLTVLDESNLKKGFNNIYVCL